MTLTTPLSGTVCYRQAGTFLLTLLRLTHLMEMFPWDDLRKILQGSQTMAKVNSGEEILPKGSTP